MKASSAGRLALLVALATAVAAHAAVFDCEINGQYVNPANGATTAGKTGIMKCVDRDTRKLQREVEYRNGREIGYRKTIDLWGKTTVGHYNEQGNRDGELKEYDKDGNLLAEERYVNGEATGVQIHYHVNRQVKRKSYSEPRKGSLASLEWNDRGELMNVRCSDRPLLGEDRALCGFDGKVSEVTLHNAKGEVAGQARFENGKRLSMTALRAPGVVARSEEAQGERRVIREHYPDGPLKLETVVVGNRRESERELAKSGQAVRETHWVDGRVAEENLWYLNGQPRSRTRYERDGKRVLVKAEEFWDNGKIRARTVRDERQNYIGVQQRYAESGALESEATYDQGQLTRRRNYKDGVLVLDEQYFEDGSRKSTRKSD